LNGTFAEAHDLAGVSGARPRSSRPLLHLPGRAVRPAFEGLHRGPIRSPEAPL